MVINTYVPLTITNVICRYFGSRTLHHILFFLRSSPLLRLILLFVSSAAHITALSVMGSSPSICYPSSPWKTFSITIQIRPSPWKGAECRVPMACIQPGKRACEKACNTGLNSRYRTYSCANIQVTFRITGDDPCRTKITVAMDNLEHL